MLRSRVLRIAGVVLLTCSVALPAADNRELGTWRLRSERDVEGSSVAMRLGVGTIATVRKGASGNFVIQLEPKQPLVTDKAVVVGEDFSADGKTKTETIISGKPQYRIIRIWDKQ